MSIFIVRKKEKTIFVFNFEMFYAMLVA
jgi:hypothetical protein